MIHINVSNSYFKIMGLEYERKIRKAVNTIYLSKGQIQRHSRIDCRI